MKYLTLTWCLMLCFYNINAQNTVTIQGNFSTSNTNTVTLRCNQTIPSIEVEVLDGSNNPVIGEDVTATKASGTGTLNGTLTRITDSNGIAIFDDLSFSANNDLTIQFEDTNSNTDTTKTIESLECEIDEVWTDYGGFWNSSSTSINPVEPDNSHDLLAFEFNGVTYSTGVDDPTLTSNSVTFTALTIRALPIASLPADDVVPNYIQLGEDIDGITNGIDSGSTNPFAPISTSEGARVASYLTDGEQGLDLGTSITNIPVNTEAEFPLSSNGINTSQIGDGIPDIIISQTAIPNNDFDELRFEDSAGNTVGSAISIDIQNEPTIGIQTVDLYRFDSTIGSPPNNNLIQVDKDIRFLGLELTDFGITTANAGNADKLVYVSGGSSDPAFIAFNEPSLGVASRLSIISQPDISTCNNLVGNIVVQVEDTNGNGVAQSGIEITATVETGPGSLLGTTTVSTNGTGAATFDDLEFDTTGTYTIKFSALALTDAITTTIDSSDVTLVTGVYTNYAGFWSSFDDNINAIKPDNSHEVLAFVSDGTTYSTGVDDAELTNQSVSFTALEMRALPFNTLPTTGGTANFVSLGQIIDGIDNGVDNGTTNPFSSITNGGQVAEFLTDGERGLDLGTGVTNIPTGTETRFELSDIGGIDTGEIGDCVPDILVSQTAQPSTSDFDELEFVDDMGETVGNVVQINISNEPIVGNSDIDLYKFDSTQNDNTRVNTEREIHFYAADLSEFGISTSNAGDVVALLYRPTGQSDPSFIAYNSSALGVATQLAVTSQPSQQNCDGTLPSNIEVELQDGDGNPVEQDNLMITATLDSGPGSLTGTLTQTTNSSGVATFNDLEFTVGGNHVIRFSNGSLDEATTTNISNATGCSTIEWDGSESTDWSDPDNWTTGVVPDANNEVIINNGRPRYPVLDVDAGAGDLTMQSATSIQLNGFLLALNGDLSNVASGASIDASAAGSELYMSDASAQNLISGFIEPDVANFTVENAGGVTLNSEMNITEVLNVREGTLTSNDHISMVCSFSPRGTAQIDAIDGSITGDITVEQCFPARRAFRLVSPSTTTTTTIRENWQEDAASYDDTSVEDNYGTHITGVEPNDPNDPPVSLDGTNGFDWNGSGDISMFTFNNSLQTWENVSNTDVNTLIAGEPYRLLIRSARVDGGVAFDIDNNAATPTDTRLRSTGTVEDGNFSIPNADLSQTGTLGNNWNLIGNPYHAMIDMKALIDNSTSLSRFYTIWDPTLGGTPTVGQPGGRGAFVTYNVDELEFTIDGGASGTSDINGYLQPYQAAFIRTNTNGTATVDFTEAMIDVDAGQTDTFSNQGILPFPHIYSKLFASNDYGVASPLAVNQIRFESKASNAFDQFDAQAFYNVDETLARLGDNQIWAFERRDLPVVGEILPLLTWQYVRTNYTFEFEIGEFENVDVYLEDTYLNETHLLEDMQLNTVNFTVDVNIPASIAFNRFRFVFEQETFSITDEELRNQIKLYPNPANDVVHLSFGDLNLNEVQISITDMQGRQIKTIEKENMTSDEIQVNTSDLSQGVYFVRINSGQYQHTDKLIVE